MKAKVIPEQPLLADEREALHEDLRGTTAGEDAVVAEPIMLTVKRTYSMGGKPLAEEEQNENLQVPVFMAEPAKVGISLGQTINMGNYESVRVEVSLTLPCYAPEAPEAFEYAQSFVRARVVQEREAAAVWAKEHGSKHLF